MFEVVSEEQYSGVVIDRMQVKGTNISSGLLQYELDGVSAKLTYGPRDLQVPHHELYMQTSTLKTKSRRS